MNQADDWWKDSIIYVLDVEKFYDSNHDGIGDFPGLTEKLDYIAELGVNCIWLLPFYASTHRDNGYDITDYFHVDPRQGTLDEFIAFVHAAGERGIRVICDFVTNHTSNKHPWFEAARNNNTSRYRDYYYWSANPPPTPPDKGNMFPGEENSVWTYDETARAYYYHRFYHFQPSLNPHNENVREELERVVDFWMSFGVSGLRIDSAAHMVDSPSPEFKKLGDPHDVLRKIHSTAKAAKADCVLIGEVDIPPEELEPYMDGEQLDMLFSFYFNNHIYLALATEKAAPVVTALDKLPNLPHHVQWANFLRNFDEINLARISKDEREKVFEAFAPREDMRIYGRGIRRRLAPMLGNMARLKMAYSLLFSLPGAPSFVYGEEIGMGDDLSQHGRWSVRTPMQWDSGKNAGFSNTAKSKLVQPLIETGRFNYKKVNVALEQKKDSSLLEHIKRLCHLRQRLRVIRQENLTVISGLPETALGFIYRKGQDTLIVLHNFAGEKLSFNFPHGLPDAKLKDAFTGEQVDGKKITLPPYGFIWLTSSSEENV